MQDAYQVHDDRAAGIAALAALRLSQAGAPRKCWTQNGGLTALRTGLVLTMLLLVLPDPARAADEAVIEAAAATAVPAEAAQADNNDPQTDPTNSGVPIDQTPTTDTTATGKPTTDTLGLISTPQPLALIEGSATLPDLHGEPQVQPDCAASNLKIEPCSPIAASLLAWVNASAMCFQQGYEAALGTGAVATSAKLSCRTGIMNNRRTRMGGRWSQHRYGRACDGNRITVNDVTFSYRQAVNADRTHARERDADFRFYDAFLDCWGPPGPGVDAKGQIVLDQNRGVRDWREDPRGHSDHYHLSVPCMTCIWGDMAYE